MRARIYDRQRNPADAAEFMLPVSFTDAYKNWRNRARKFSLESIVSGAIEILCEPSSDPVAELGKAPWLTLLMVKWACQDRHSGRAHMPAISRAQLNDLRQRLWDFPERLYTGSAGTMPPELFMRQLVRPQLGFQRALTKSFVREAALLGEQPENHPLRRLFVEKTAFDVLAFIDLSLATSTRIVKGERAFPAVFLNSLHPVHAPEVVSAFQRSIARTLPDLVTFCRSLPDANRKVASEFFEFPVLTRYPFFQNGSTMICWHPAVFYRGLESFVHSVLSEAGPDYIEPFSRLFEQHVLAEAGKVPARLFGEDALRGLISAETQVPDGLLSFPGCNVFIEAKAGLYRESVMTVGNSDVFAHKTTAIRKAVGQAWATSLSLREQRRAPLQVLEADADYLLIVTNKELGAGRGTALASMYPKGTLDYPNADAERLLPRKRVYVLSIDDFERLTNAAASGYIELPAFLASCVHDDAEPRTARQLFEQHLNERSVPARFSHTIEKAIDASFLRLRGALGG